MKIKILLATLFVVNLLFAQNAETLPDDPPLDGVVAKNVMLEKQVLSYPPLREADILWEKKVWRILDVREKMNLTFAYPERPFFEILLEGIVDEKIRAFSTEDDKFSFQLTADEVASMGATRDTIYILNPETLVEEMRVVENKIDISDVKRFRLKEVWYFDTNRSAIEVRILGIAPLINEYDDEGNFKYERPLFWVYYPECRELLAREQVFNSGNDSSLVSWEDLMERREFSSVIYKVSNIHDRRLQDYLSGVDLLLEAEKAKMEIFNFEHDLWSY